VKSEPVQLGDEAVMEKTDWAPYFPAEIPDGLAWPTNGMATSPERIRTAAKSTETDEFSLKETILDVPNTVLPPDIERSRRLRNLSRSLCYT
jgi:hypothetical protein